MSVIDQYQGQYAGKEISLYLHIPFCEHLCHYCDFAKTANFSGTNVTAYFDFLQQKLSKWHQELGAPQIKTVFIGGGTPSLFAHEYQKIANYIRPFLSDQYEWTIEANPAHINESFLKIWRDCGINRLSLGVQSFDPQGLTFLTRKHSNSMAISAIEKSQKYFENLSIDLIYGWPEQTIESCQNDLDIINKYQIPHISAY